MKLTRKQAIDGTIEMWTELAETGEEKRDWSGWEKLKYIMGYCFLCEYCGRDEERFVKCRRCPLKWGRYGCEEHKDSQYANWMDATGKEEHKKYAALFLEQLKQIRGK